MYCRVCGSLINEKAEMCVKCGCRPLNGNEHCQECGSKTTEKQELCIRCGCRLKTSIAKSTNILDNFSIGNSDDNGEINLDFSHLPEYYQQEFKKIYESGEVYKGKFNIWAFLFGNLWALSKGCWLFAVVTGILCVITYGVAAIGATAVVAFRGNYIYYCYYVKGKQTIF